MAAIADVIRDRTFPRSEWVGCPVCGARHEPRQFPVKFGMTVSVAECPTCRIAYQTPRPTPEASLAYMNMRWGSSETYVSDTKSQLKRAAKQLELIRPYLDREATLLDFGAGSGNFVRAALDAGYKTTGVESSDRAVARAHEVFGVELQKELKPGSTYDVITLWDVVEHLRDPIAVLAMLREHLRPGGRIFLETGNYENWTRLARGDAWGLYLFDHQFYFTPSSLQKIAERAGLSEFRLLPARRKGPPGVLSFLSDPRESLRAWQLWSQARRDWPDHGDVNVMVATAIRPR